MTKKRKRAPSGYTMICTECGSVDISKNRENPLSPYLPPLYTCNKCSHTSHIFPEVKLSEVQSFRKRIFRDVVIEDDSEKVDMSYGRFEVHIMWKITGPVIFFIGMILLLMSKEQAINFLIPLLLIVVGAVMIYITYLTKME